MTISLPVIDMIHPGEHAEHQTPADPQLAGAAAALAGSLIAASGRPHSINEAIALWHELQFAMDSRHGHGTPTRAAWDAMKKLEDPHI